MKKSINVFLFSLFTIMLNSCIEQNPNLNEAGKDELKSLQVEKKLNEEDIQFEDIIYVPIYSDIYIDSSNRRELLTATLSIRNTSLSDTLYVSSIDYYNTGGSLVRKYIDNTISLNPMATINYVVEKEDVSGGSGANFIVELNSKKSNIKPLIQAIMIGQYSNKSFAFSTDGYSIKAKKLTTNLLKY